MALPQEVGYLHQQQQQAARSPVAMNSPQKQQLLFGVDKLEQTDASIATGEGDRPTLPI